MLLLRLLEAESSGSSLEMTSSSWPHSSRWVLELSWDLRCSRRSMGMDFLALITKKIKSSLYGFNQNPTQPCLYVWGSSFITPDTHDVSGGRSSSVLPCRWRLCAETYSRLWQPESMTPAAADAPHSAQQTTGRSETDVRCHGGRRARCGKRRYPPCLWNQERKKKGGLKKTDSQRHKQEKSPCNNF